MNTTDSTTTTVIVSGAGIAGLSFAIAACQRILSSSSPTSSTPAASSSTFCNKNVRILILERGRADDLERKTAYTHTMSIRPEGEQVIDKLGLTSMLHEKSRSRDGGFLASATSPNKPVRIVYTSEWGSTVRAFHRILRFDLWQALRDRALELSGTSGLIEIRYNCEVVKAEIVDDGQKRVRVTTRSNEVIVGDLLVGADGVRSATRQAICADGNEFNWEKSLIIGGNIRCEPGEDTHLIPSIMRRRHGMVCGPMGSSMFLSDDGENVYIASLAFPSEKQYPHDAINTDAELRARVSTIGNSYPYPYSAMIQRMLNPRQGEVPRVISCNDRMPTAPVGGRVVFLGDASHPVSPYGGTGANMALDDGLQLADALFGQGCESRSLEESVELFFHLTCPLRTKSVIHQRRALIFSNLESGWKYHARQLVFTILPFLANPSKRRQLLAWGIAFCLAAAAAPRWWKRGGVWW